MPGYPTWEINGALYPGEKSIEQLEEIARGEVPPPPAFLYGDGDASASGGDDKAAVAAADAGGGSG